MISDDQLKQIRDIVQGYFGRLAVGVAGTESIDAEQLQAAIDAGYIDPGSLPPSAIGGSFDLGRDAAVKPAVMNYDWDRYNEQVRGLKKPTKAAVLAKRFAAKRAGEYLTLLGDRTETDIVSRIQEVDKANQMVDTIRQEVPEAIKRGKDWNWLRSELGHSQEDWRRDYIRVAKTEMNNAYHEGIGVQIIESDGMDALVAKIVNPDACDKCRSLYMSGGQPRIFKIGDLFGKSNARDESGQKRKTADWIPTLESAHPNCRCALIQIPDGFSLNEKFQLVRDGQIVGEDQGENV
jgi:hypothetical protein